jgi:bifunctional DNA-binding transcriptional regulator/antitoxin component of YhaV-PrlF toxin-antitoxin module
MAMPDSEVARIVASEASVSDKIRALDAAGYSRADIARALGKRYQHVRNVLEGDKTRGSGVSEPPAAMAWAAPAPGDASGRAVPTPGAQVFRLVVGADGEIVLPEAARARLGIRPGDVVMGHVEGDRLVLMNAIASARLAQELVRAAIPGDDSLVDSLIRDRRREAAQEANA